MKRVLALLTLASLTTASAIDISFQKIFGRYTSTPTNHKFGDPGAGRQSLACNQSWIVVGSPNDSTGGLVAGSVHVFNTSTGAFVRKILPPVSAGSTFVHFGSACSLSGNLLLVGAWGAGTSGEAYLYDLATGALKHTFGVPGGASGSRFGISVALAGSKVAVGAPGYSGFSGAVFVFDATSGAVLKTLLGSSAAGEFGSYISAEGNYLLVASQQNGGGWTELFDLNTYDPLRSFTPATVPVDGKEYGEVVALHSHSLITSSMVQKEIYVSRWGYSKRAARFTSTDVNSADFGHSLAVANGMLIAGSQRDGMHSDLHVYDLGATHGTEAWRIPSPEGSEIGFGTCLAMWGDTVVVAAPLDDTQAMNAGAVYILRNVRAAMGLTKVAARNDFAPGAVDISYNSFNNVSISPTGTVAFTSGLTGTGSNKGTDTAAFSHLLGTDLLLKSRDVLGGTSIGKVNTQWHNYSFTGWLSCSLAGAGVTPATNAAILKDDGTNVIPYLRTGTVVASFSNDGTVHDAAPSAFQAIAGGRSGALGTVTLLKHGIAGTAVINDSALTLWNPAGGFKTERENETVSNHTFKYGQIAPRLAYTQSHAAYAAAIQGATAQNQGIFVHSLIAANEGLLARKGDTPAGFATGSSLTGTNFNSFVGESTSSGSDILFRAVIAGTGVTSANNEGLWLATAYNSMNNRLVLRKGQDLGTDVGTDFIGLPELAGVKIGKFIHFWLAGDQPLALVQLIGPGVNSANDLAVLLFQQTAGLTNKLMVLMREGQYAPGCGAATIGTLQQIEVEPEQGHYLVQATLAGAGGTENLALFSGFSSPSLGAESGIKQARRPALLLRKGAVHSNQPSPVKSFYLPKGNINAGGAGGLGQHCALAPVGSGQSGGPKLAILVEFSNGMSQVMSGQLD
jgi:hypothetical protein